MGKGSWLAEQVLGVDLSAQLGQEPHPRGHVPIGQEARADLFVGCFAEPSPAPSSVTTGQRRPREGRERDLLWTVGWRGHRMPVISSRLPSACPLLDSGGDPR